MKMMLDLPDALVNEIEMRARREGRKLDDAVAELLRKGLAVAERPSASVRVPILRTHPQSGLPYIECPIDAPARTMTLQELCPAPSGAGSTEAEPVWRVCSWLWLRVENLAVRSA